jgi:hypothetical protein
MDHGTDFGWKDLSMCTGFRLDEEREVQKRQKRQLVEMVRRRWKRDKVEFVDCELFGWEEDVERYFQRRITGSG